jgi:hypothetical protein
MKDHEKISMNVGENRTFNLEITRKIGPQATSLLGELLRIQEMFSEKERDSEFKFEYNGEFKWFFVKGCELSKNVGMHTEDLCIGITKLASINFIEWYIPLENNNDIEFFFKIKKINLNKLAPNTFPKDKNEI